MKWDDEKKKKTNPDTDNQNPAILKLKKNGTIQGTTVTNPNGKGKPLSEFIKDNDTSLPDKIGKKLDEFKKSIFKETTTYRTAGLQTSEKFIDKTKKKTLAELLPNVFTETTTYHTVGLQKPDKKHKKIKE